jgi:hypothetical protein
MASLIAKCFVEASPDFIGLISAPETLSFKAGQGIRLSMASTAHPGLLVTALARSRIVISGYRPDFEPTAGRAVLGLRTCSVPEKAI